MAGSIVLELQQDALDKTVRVSDLLRKALVVAKKLKITEFEDWIEQELAGYTKPDSTPDYRRITGELKAWNPYHGWRPFYIDHPEKHEAARRRELGAPIAAVDETLGQGDNGTLHMPFPPELERQLMNGMNVPLQPTLMIDRNTLVRVADAVRNIVLKWTLKLEEDSILGKGLQFSPAERDTAARVTYHVNNFYGAVGQSNVQQDSSHSHQVAHVNTALDLEAVAGFVARLAENQGKLSLPHDALSELRAELATIQSQLQSPRPKQGVIRECLASLRRILESASGSAAAPYLPQLVALFDGLTKG